MLIELGLAYLRYAPIKPGKWRLAALLERHVGHRKGIVRTADGFLMHLDTSDFLQRTIFLTRQWDECVAEFVRKLKPGDLFVDCGANVGYFSLLAASRGAGVIAFEPNPRSADAFAENVALNRFDKIEIRRIGLNKDKGTGTIYIGDAGNLGGASLKVAAGEKVPIEFDSLDVQLGGAVPSLIKLDIEGAEVMALKGAQQLLAAPNAPPILCEVSENSLLKLGSSKDELFELMSRHGYSAEIISPVGRSNSSTTSIYFQYDVIFTKSGR